MRLTFSSHSFWAVSFAGALLIATPAFADTITFGSYVGTSATGLSNGVVTYDNTGSNAPQTSLLKGNVSSISNWAYVNALAGTSWVSYDPNSNSGDNAGVTMYSTSYTGNLAGYAGSISVSGDDSVAIYLNNVFIGTTSSSNAYSSIATFNIVPGDYVNGTNTFRFAVNNSSGPTGLDFKATAMTPEPSSLLLLGTGALGLAGSAGRRLKRKKASAIVPQHE